MNQAVRITSLADFQRVFGGVDPTSEASYAIQQYFLNGGSSAYVVRVANGEATAGAALHMMPTPNEVLVANAANPGLWGNNVRIDVVDEHLSPVALGEPGEIVFSGVCVGRGYINDPERTRSAFLPDPHRPGGRLYRSGDYGRWLPDGKLEFLGRRDSQVKISGFRIEIGEIESALVRLPGVRDGAVVVSNKQLIAFYSGAEPLDANALRTRLGEKLPTYMVPAAFHWRPMSIWIAWPAARSV